MAERARGFSHHVPTEKLLAFAALPAEEKLRWLEELRQLMARGLTPERRALMERFRKGEI